MTLPTRCTIGICSKGSCPVFLESKSFLADELNPIFLPVIEQIFHFDSCWRKFKRESSPYNEPIGVFLCLLLLSFVLVVVLLPYPLMPRMKDLCHVHQVS